MKSEVLRHYGVMVNNGAILSTPRDGSGSIEDMPTFAEAERRRVRARENLGEPFFELTGRDKQEMIPIGDGWLVPIEGIEMVFNDAQCIDFICGDGTYERVCRRAERAVLPIARKMFAEARRGS